MSKRKKSLSYVLAFLTVLSSFTVLPGQLSNSAVVYGADVAVEESQVVATNSVEITTENASNTKTSTVETGEEQTYAEGDFTYSIINDNEVKIVNYKGSQAIIVIPDVTTGSQCPELADKKVTAIGDSAFYEKGLTSVTFGKNITSIGDSAFYLNTDIVELDLSACVNLTKIGKCAFAENNSLLNLTLPDNLEIIDDGAFRGCDYLAKLETGSKLQSIGYQAFYGCNRLTAVNIKGGNNATIGTNAFYDCNALKSISIGNGVTAINKYAFRYCKNLTSLDIADSVTTIGFGAFMECGNLSELSLGKGIEIIDGYAFKQCNSLTDLSLGGNLKTIGEYAFAECNALESVNIVDGVELIDGYAFFNNPVLKSAKIGNSVKTIVGNAFDRCAGLVDLSLGNSIETIGDYAFRSTSMESVVIPDSVKSIGMYGFSDTTSLKNVTIGSGCTSINEYSFQGATALESITVSEDNTAYSSVDGVLLNKDKTEILVYPKARSGAYTMPSTVTAITGYAVFENCTNLTEVTFSDGIQTIENGAFKGCTKLSKVTFGSGLTSIGQYAFQYVNTLSEVDFSKCVNLTSIGIDAFRETTALAKLDLSKCTSLTTIDRYAFCNSGLAELILPNNLVTIRDYAFCACDNLTKLEIEGKINTIGCRAFGSCASLKTVNIKSADNAYIGMSAFRGCEALENVIIGDGVATIGLNAFSHCSNLKKVDIGNTVKNIREYAFECCENLSEVKIGEGINIIQEHSFGDCDKLTTVKILGKELTSILSNSIPNRKDCTIYCYENSTTHNTLKSKGYTNIKYIAKEVHLTDITVNGVSIDNFSTEIKDYTVYVNNLADVSVVPVFEEADVKYTAVPTVTADSIVYEITVFDEYDNIIDTYTISVWEHGYKVTGDITLMLNNISSTKVGGSIVLQPGTYKLKIARGDVQFGYNKVVTDYSNALTLSDKYISYITLNATGGTYTFQLDKVTNKLVIKYDSNLPNEYLTGDLDTILKPVGTKPISIGTKYLKAGTYKFKLSIGGVEYGYNKVINNVTTGSLSVNSKYNSYLTLNATGGMYTFVLNTETNRLEVRHTATTQERSDDVHISGDINLVLNDTAEDGTILNKATGNISLSEGTYTLKVHNYGIVYTAGIVMNEGTPRVLSNNYTTAVTLNLSGGNYDFVFSKDTGSLFVQKVGK
ncbi:MAG: leucine-rich repeat domain-containing protein [Acutalibacteraceae bacterium]